MNISLNQGSLNRGSLNWILGVLHKYIHIFTLVCMYKRFWTSGNGLLVLPIRFELSSQVFWKLWVIIMMTPLLNYVQHKWIWEWKWSRAIIHRLQNSKSSTRMDMNFFYFIHCNFHHVLPSKKISNLCNQVIMDWCLQLNLGSFMGAMWII